MKNRKKRYILIFMLIIITFCILVTPVFALILNDLDDVNVYVPKECNFLHYNGTMWTNYDLWNQSVTWYKPHNFIDNITAINITAIRYFGDGGNLTGISTGALPSYLNAIGHPHNQDLNTTNSPTFSNITLSAVPTWFNMFTHNNWNNITDKPSHLNTIGHPHNQNLNTSNSPTFSNITLSTVSTWFYMFTHNSWNNLTDIPSYLTSQSGARVRLRNAQTISSFIWTQLELEEEDYDLNNDFDSGSYLFYVDVEGLYQISYSVKCLEISDGDYLMSGIYKNGNLEGGLEITYCSTTGDLSNSGSDILYLEPFDYIELFVYHSMNPSCIFPAETYTNYLAICKIA